MRPERFHYSYQQEKHPEPTAAWHQSVAIRSEDELERFTVPPWISLATCGPLFELPSTLAESHHWMVWPTKNHVEVARVPASTWQRKRRWVGESSEAGAAGDFDRLRCGHRWIDEASADRGHQCSKGHSTPFRGFCGCWRVADIPAQHCGDRDGGLAKCHDCWIWLQGGSQGRRWCWLWHHWSRWKAPTHREF